MAAPLPASPPIAPPTAPTAAPRAAPRATWPVGPAGGGAIAAGFTPDCCVAHPSRSRPRRLRGSVGGSPSRGGGGAGAVAGARARDAAGGARPRPGRVAAGAPVPAGGPLVGGEAAALRETRLPSCAPVIG